jgi:hypothetical protein
MNLFAEECSINENIFRIGMNIYQLIWNSITHHFDIEDIFNVKNYSLLSFYHFIILNFDFFLKVTSFLYLIIPITFAFCWLVNLCFAIKQNIFTFSLWSAPSIILCIYFHAIDDFFHSFLSLTKAFFTSILYDAFAQTRETQI